MPNVTVVSLRISYVVTPHSLTEVAMTRLDNIEMSCIELSDAELSEVSAGKFNGFANFGDIKGESTDKDHKDWVMIF